MQTFGNIGDKVSFENDDGIHKGYIKNNTINHNNNIIIRSEKLNYFIDITEVKFIKEEKEMKNKPVITFGNAGDKILIDETMRAKIYDNKVSEDCKILVNMRNLKYYTYVIHIDRIRIINSEKQDDKMSNRWEFKSVVREDIDYNLLLQDITKKNPIMLITSGKEKIIGIHHSLINKTRACCIQMPKYEDNSENFVLTEEDFSVWIDWAKKVKRARWPTEMVNKRKVKVVLPTI